MNWVPADSTDPLVIDKYFNLLRELLLDYMVDEVVKPDDPKMSQPSGLQVTNRNGKTITFKQASGGESSTQPPYTGGGRQT